MEHYRTGRGVVRTIYSLSPQWNQNGYLVPEGVVGCEDDWEFSSYVVREVLSASGEVLYEAPSVFCTPKGE